MKKLVLFRKNIDQIDNEIIFLLGKRFNIVKKIGRLKKKKGLLPLDKKRWEKVLVTRKKWGTRKKLDPDFIEKIFISIHNEALKVEDKL